MFLLIVAIAVCIALYVYLQQEAKKGAQGAEGKKNSLRSSVSNQASEGGDVTATANQP
ncbi:hypothetical protein NECAME_13180, partial [Necator americanus]